MFSGDGQGRYAYFFTVNKGIVDSEVRLNTRKERNTQTICLPACLLASQPTCQPLSVSLFFSLSVCLCLCLSLSLSLSPSLSLCLYLSVSLSPAPSPDSHLFTHYPQQQQKTYLTRSSLLIKNVLSSFILQKHLTTTNWPLIARFCVSAVCSVTQTTDRDRQVCRPSWWSQETRW